MISGTFSKPGHKIALFGCALAVVVIMLGAFTRLADAGLGCPDWPGCYGHLLWPNSEHEIATANQAYPHMPVLEDKTWPEMVHRYFASSLGLLSIILFWVCWRHRGEGRPIKLPAFLLAFVILQGMFGMWTVTLKLWPQVVAAHLLGGFTTLSLLWLMHLRLSGRQWNLNRQRLSALQGFKSWAAVGLLIVCLQIALGGWTTSNYAALACPDLPTCQAQWWPAMDFAQGFNLTQHIGPNYLGGTMDNDSRVAIHMSHRIGAVVTALILIVLSLRLFASGVGQLKQLGVWIIGILSLQILLGLSNILFSFPLSVAVAHNAVGAFLLLSLVTLNYRVFSARSV